MLGGGDRGLTLLLKEKTYSEDESCDGGVFEQYDGEQDAAFL